jgi:5-methylcytosine-specific restriction endonuclease McrA
MVTTRQLAEKVIELYWRHCEPYPNPDEPKQPSKILHQSTAGADKQALIVRHILQFQAVADPKREHALPLSRARFMAPPGAYQHLVDDVEWTLVHMPLPRLQIVGRVEDRFLYEYNFTQATTRGAVELAQRGKPGPFDNRLNLRPGVGTSLVALNGILRPLIFRNWTAMVATMNSLRQSELAAFLFGEERISLIPLRTALVALQAGRCFYCHKAMVAECDVDHFVPWARHADNSIDNLVAAHRECNGKKSDFLAAAEHVEKWRARSVEQDTALVRIAEEQRWESRPERTLSVARAIYGMLPDDARLWRQRNELVLMERPRIVAALAA